MLSDMGPEVYLLLVFAFIHHEDRSGVGELRAVLLFMSLLCTSLVILWKSECSVFSTKCILLGTRNAEQVPEQTVDEILPERECDQIRNFIKAQEEKKQNGTPPKEKQCVCLYGTHLPHDTTSTVRYGPSYVNLELQSLQGDNNVQNEVKKQRDIMLFIHVALICAIKYHDIVSILLPKASEAGEKTPRFNLVLLLDPILMFNALVLYTVMRRNPGLTYPLLVYLTLQAYALHDLVFPHQTTGVLSEFIGGPCLLLVFYVATVYHTRNVLPDFILYVIRDNGHFGLILVEMIFFLIYCCVGQIHTVLTTFGMREIGTPVPNGNYDLAEQVLGFENKPYCQLVVFVLTVLVPGLSMCTMLQKVLEWVQFYRKVSNILYAPARSWSWKTPLVS